MTGEPDSVVRVEVDVEYSQYYLEDSGSEPEYERVGPNHDGVLAPLGPHGLAVGAGVSSGPVDVELTFTEPTEDVAPHEVAAECDLEVTSGLLRLSTLSALWLTYDFGAPERLRVRAVVEGRPEWNQPGPPERHRLWLWPSPEPRPRWRSRAIDQTGKELEQVTDHVG